MDYIKLIDLYVGRGTKSGVDYQLTSDDYGVTAEFEFWDIADKPQPTIEQLEALQPQLDIIENNENVKAQITELEAKQPRALREFALGYEGAQSRLQNIEAQISQLRAML